MGNFNTSSSSPKKSKSAREHGLLRLRDPITSSAQNASATEDNTPVKALLVGSSMSGKTTLSSQMQWFMENPQEAAESSTHKGEGEVTADHDVVVGRFSPKYNATIGIDFRAIYCGTDPLPPPTASDSERTEHRQKHRGETLQLWDCPTSVPYRSLSRAHWRAAKRVAWVFDVTNRAEFDAAVSTLSDSVNQFADDDVKAWLKRNRGIADDCDGDGGDDDDAVVAASNASSPRSCAVFLCGTKIDLRDNAFFGGFVSSEEGRLAAERLGCIYLETSAKTGEGVMDLVHALYFGVLCRRGGADVED